LVGQQCAFEERPSALFLPKPHIHSLLYQVNKRQRKNSAVAREDALQHTVPVAVMTFKVIQCQRFLCNPKRCMPLSIND